MILQKSIQNVFDQLIYSLDQLSFECYTKPIKSVTNASIGQHVRHIIELFQCLEKGYDTGIVNYEKRKRDVLIETDKELAVTLLRNIYIQIDRSDKYLVLEADDYSGTSDKLEIPTNYLRELAYNLEHTIHHMALIRVGFTETGVADLPEDYGVAYSTIKFKKACAQ